jgi:O-Antigen ligase
VTSLALLLFIAAASLYPTISDPDYAWKTHFATAVKFSEFFVLAPATAVLLRDRRSLDRFYGAIAIFTIAAAGVASLQFVGVHIFRAWPAGAREPSFTGISDLGALGAAALAIGFLGAVWPGSVSGRSRTGLLAGGALALVLSGEAAAGLGVGVAMIAALVIAHRRHTLGSRQALVVIGVTVVCAFGVIGIRSGDILQAGRSAGVVKADKSTTEDVQTYAQRTLMLYIGLRIWEAHPVFGAGWQSVREPAVFRPFLGAAHRRFPSQPPLAFPSQTNRWGVDNAYVQSLAELGVVGTAFFLVFISTAVVLGVRGSLRLPPPRARLALAGLLWMLVSIGMWTGQGLVGGAGFTALPFFALGLIAAGRAPAPASRRTA